MLSRSDSAFREIPFRANSSLLRRISFAMNLSFCFMVTDCGAMSSNFLRLVWLMMMVLVLDPPPPPPPPPDDAVVVVVEDPGSETSGKGYEMLFEGMIAYPSGR